MCPCLHTSLISFHIFRTEKCINATAHARILRSVIDGMRFLFSHRKIARSQRLKQQWHWVRLLMVFAKSSIDTIVVVPMA